MGDMDRKRKGLIWRFHKNGGSGGGNYLLLRGVEKMVFRKKGSNGTQDKGKEHGGDLL